MALTAQDLDSIKHLFDDRFDSYDRQFKSIDAQFASIKDQFKAVRGDIDALALATAAGFAEVNGRLDEVQEDVAVIKDVVKDHSFRLSRLEHHIRPAD